VSAVPSRASHPIYSETSLDDPQMSQARRALELILEQQELFGAVVFDRHWDIVMVNVAYAPCDYGRTESACQNKLPLSLVSHIFLTR